MPEEDFPIKERMLYSTCKGPLLDFVEKQLGLTVVKKVGVHFCAILWILVFLTGDSYKVIFRQTLSLNEL
jgi:hypothetical protein